MSFALNFGANVTEDDGGALYAIKGLTGGYPGTFASNPYFEKIQEYSRLENRDMWEYRLNLTPDEVNRLLEHVWELKEIEFDYYFFDENCSFRLLELLEVARPTVNLLDDFPVAAIPIDTIRIAQQNDMIASAYYRPSVLTELKHQIDLLDEAGQQAVLLLAQDATYAQSSTFKQLPQQQQNLAIDTAYRYLRYQNTHAQRDPEISKRSFALLKLMRANKLGELPVIPRPTDPLDGHLTTMWGFGGGHDEKGAYGDITLRGSYHDLLDPAPGFFQGCHLICSNLWPEPMRMKWSYSSLNCLISCR